MLNDEALKALDEVPKSLWSTGKNDVGLIKKAQPVVVRGKSDYRPNVKQYPLRQDARDGIRPLIADMLKGGILVECPEADCNSPIFPVKKKSKDNSAPSWRLVQDLREVNKATRPSTSVVPDPHLLLNSLKPDMTCFSVVDLSNAFFSLKIDKASQSWFAFTYEGKKYTFTRLVQGWHSSPHLFNREITNCLADLHIPESSQILAYVDDLLVASPTEEECKQVTVLLLKHLAQTGNKASLEKLQFCQQAVVFLGHTLSREGRRINKDRKTAMLETPKPKTKKQLMQFLGMTNYCRSWVSDYAERTQPLLDIMYTESINMSQTLQWTEAADKAFIDIKQCLVNSGVLALPRYDRPFIQTVDCKNGFMTSVLTQPHGGKHQPVGYYSKRLDPVAQALPPCVQAVCAAAMAVQTTAEIVLYHPLKLLVTHAVSMLLNETKMAFLSPARFLSLTATLMSQPHLTIERCSTLNPATLMPVQSDGDPHSCKEETERICKPRPDLQDTQLDSGETYFCDGSCSKSETGQNQSGFAVVTATSIVRAGKLPHSFSAQAAELIALTEACRAGAGKDLTCYTDSQYAFSAVQTFDAQWARRGMKTSTGKPIHHAKLLNNLLKAVLLPRRLAICKCAAHTKQTDFVSLGNAYSDKIAKEASLGLHGQAILLHTEQSAEETPPPGGVPLDVIRDMQTNAPDTEKQKWVRD